MSEQALTVWEGGGRVRMLVPCDGGETEVEMEPAQAVGLADLLLAHAGRPPLLPPLTAVQRAWVVAMAEAERGGPGDWFALYAWARRRWGKPWPRMLWNLAEAVGIWRAGQVARDA